jgi:ferredoxin
MSDVALLIGPTTLLLKRAEAARLAGLRPALLCTDHPAVLPRGLRALPGELADLRGSQGAFQAWLRGRDGPTDLGPLSFHGDGHFDWVLDFTGAPSPRLTIPGRYDLPADDYPAFKTALMEIAAQLQGIEAPPPGPPGELEIAAGGCTLCGACVNLCGYGALTLIGDAPRQLQFSQARCTSCGQCVQGCPEQVIALKPLPAESPPALLPRVVAEADILACAGCGQPYAPRALVARSRALMADHPMFQGEQARLMDLCPNCRQQAMAGRPF